MEGSRGVKEGSRITSTVHAPHLDTRKQGNDAGRQGIMLVGFSIRVMVKVIGDVGTPLLLLYYMETVRTVMSCKSPAVVFFSLSIACV